MGLGGAVSVAPGEERMVRRRDAARDASRDTERPEASRPADQ